jgi:hypothetical protein
MISVVPVLGCVMLPEENLSRFSSCLAIAQSRPPNDIWVVAKGSHPQSMTRSVSSQPPALPRAQVSENPTLREVRADAASWSLKKRISEGSMLLLRLM